MDIHEVVAAGSIADAAIEPREQMTIQGHFQIVCVDRDGSVKWTDTIANTVVTAGKNAVLDASLAGSAYSVNGPYMGLISGISYSAIAAGDTMAAHPGWLEAGGTNLPGYSGTRKTCAFSSASAGVKALASALSFAVTADGTAKGCFVVFGTGAQATKDNGGGALLSAGLFSGGDKAVANGDTLNVNYQLSL